MSSAFEIHREGEVRYSKPIARSLLRDGRLSFGARGLFSFLWDLPSGWRTNSEHLTKMSPQGRDAVRTLLKELERVGAMRSEPIRNSSGQMAGKRWILVTPERWATESPLSPNKTQEAAPEASSAEGRVFRSSVKPTVGKSAAKVHQGEGSAIKATTWLGVEEIDELVDAAVWTTLKNGGEIKKEPGFRHKVRARILSSPTGPSPEDVQSLHAWRTAQAREAVVKNEQDNKQMNADLDTDPAACLKGEAIVAIARAKRLTTREK